MKSAKGFSLIEVLVSAVVMSFLIFVFASMIIQQRLELKAIQQKQESLELKNFLLQNFNLPTTCSWQMIGKVVDLSGVTTNATTTAANVNLVQLYQGLNTSSAIIAQAGQLLPGTQTMLRVDQVRLQEFYATGNPNEYSAEIAIIFDASSLVRSFKPVQLKKIILVNPSDPISAKTIVSCANPALIVDCIDVNVPCTGSPTGCNVTASCPIGYKLTGCWNEEDGGSIMQIVRNVGTPPQDQCLCVGGGGNCWTAQATCCR